VPNPGCTAPLSPVQTAARAGGLQLALGPMARAVPGFTMPDAAGIRSPGAAPSDIVWEFAMKLKDSQNTPTAPSDSPSCEPRRRRFAFRAWAFAGSIAALASAPTTAWASFLTGEALDKMADYLAIFVLLVVPIGAIALFWLVHILPE